MSRWIVAAWLLAGASQGAVLESGVYRPQDLGRVRRVATTDLAQLDVRRATLRGATALHDEGAHADDEELVIVTAGRVRVWFNGAERFVGRGSVALLLPGDRHVVTNAGDTPATVYVFQYRSKAPPDSARGRAAGGSFVVDWDSVRFDSTAIGGRRNIFDRATTMYRRFEMHVSTLNGGLTNHAAHTHRAEEFVLLLQGDTRLLIGEPRVNASTGDIVFLASQILHSLDNIGTGQAVYYAFQGQ